MEKVVFANPCSIFGYYWLFAIISLVCAFPLSVSPNNFLFLSIASLALAFSLFLIIFWPLQLYKFLCAKSENCGKYAQDRYDKPIIISFIVIVTWFIFAMLTGKNLENEPSPLGQELAEMTLVSIYFIVMFSIIWANTKMLKGGFWLCITQFYWPITAFYIQGRVKELYPEKNL